MTNLILRAAAVGLLLAGAAPAFAQTGTPPGAGGAGAGVHAGPQAGDRGGRHGEWRGRGGRDHMRGRAFASLSPEGRTIMRDAMHGSVDRKQDHQAIMAARDRMLTVLDADKLDSAALKRAMDDERNVVNASRDRTQAAMQAGFAKLSVADRKAFVADARALKQRMEERVNKWRGRGGMHGMGGPEGGPEGGPDAPPSGF